MIASIKQFVSRKKPKTKEVDTIPVSQITQQTAGPQGAAPKPASEPYQIEAGYAQSVGKQREHNEDAMFALTSAIFYDDTRLPFGLYIIADGMGGHQHGEIASGAAVRNMSRYVIEHLYLPLIGQSSKAPESSLQEILERGIEAAHKAIMEEAVGGGTTLTTILILGEQMVLAHIGDSRAYQINPGGEVTILTKDHSLVSRLVELGQITPEEAAVHPQRNVLYRALGQGEPAEPDMVVTHIPRGCSLLLCSDGLWGLVQKEEIAPLVNSPASAHQVCQVLVQKANDAGGPDNITAILVRIPD